MSRGCWACGDLAGGKRGGDAEVVRLAQGDADGHQVLELCGIARLAVGEARSDKGEI